MRELSSNTKFYLEAFAENKPGKLFAHWCWPAFLFGSFWLAYRKLYLFSFFYGPFAYIAPLITTLLPAYIFSKLFGESSFKIFVMVFALIGQLTPSILLGFYGVSLYGKKWVKNPIPHNEHASVLGIIPCMLLIWVAYFIISLITLMGFDFFQK